MLAEAVRDAERLGDPDLFGDAVAMWALSLRNQALFDPEHGPSLHKDALSMLDRALSLPLEVEMQGKVMYAKAMVLAHPTAAAASTPKERATLMEEAVRLSPINRWHYQMLRELSVMWLAAGQPQHAEACLRECMTDGKAFLLPADLALAHAELGRTLGVARADEAESHLREAVRLTSTSSDWGHCAVRLAEFLQSTGRGPEALDLLRKAAADLGRMPASHHWEMWRRKMVLEWSHGKRDLATAARDEALLLVKGTIDESIVRLLWAELEPTDADTLSVALAYVGGQLGPASPDGDRIAAELLTHHIGNVSPEENRRLLAWCLGRPLAFLEAVLHHAGGDMEQALACLDSAITTADHADELRFRVLRIAMLPGNPPDELRGELNRIRSMARTWDELSFSGLCDYATACRIAAQGEPGWLDRSIRGWARASARAGLESSLSEHITIGWVSAVRDRVKAAALHSDPALGSTVDELAQRQL